MTKTTVSAPRAVVALGAVGMLVGGAVSAARNYGKVQKREMTREDAVKGVLRESGTTGLATATAGAVVGVLGSTGLLSLAGVVLVAAGTKHLADKAIDARFGHPAVAASGTGDKPAARAKAAAPKKAKATKSAKAKSAKPKSAKPKTAKTTKTDSGAE